MYDVYTSYTMEKWDSLSVRIEMSVLDMISDGAHPVAHPVAPHPKIKSFSSNGITVGATLDSDDAAHPLVSSSSIFHSPSVKPSPLRISFLRLSSAARPTQPNTASMMHNTISAPLQVAFQVPVSIRSPSRHPRLSRSQFLSPSLPTTSCSPCRPSIHMSAFRLRESQTNADAHPRVATARAITPMRRPNDPSNPASAYTEQHPLPSQRRTDLMAPRKVGFWSLIPYMAASAVFLASTWVAKRRFTARQKNLVDEFGQVIVLYGNSPDTKREIISEYKRKLGPGILRGAMFASYLGVLLADKPVVPSTIQDVSLVKRLLRLDDAKAAKTINNLATSMSEAPSLLGKLLFISERLLAPDHREKLALVPLFPYSPSTVADLQRNMLERCYRDYVNLELDLNGIQEPPQAAVAALQLDPVEAKQLFDGVVLARQKQKEKEEAEIAAAAAEEASKPQTPELDSPARSGEPAKAAVHAYQCTVCGYTLFPAAGREFKFYGDDFVCPACGAPKDKFIDVNEEQE